MSAVCVREKGIVGNKHYIGHHIKCIGKKRKEHATIQMVKRKVKLGLSKVFLLRKIIKCVFKIYIKIIMNRNNLFLCINLYHI